MKDTLKVDSIPHLWRNVLAWVQRHIDSRSCIVGGALRDLHNGREVKDIDVFVPAFDVEGFADSVANLKPLLGDPAKPYDPDKSYRQWNWEVVGTADFKLGDLEVNVIGIDTPDFTPAYLMARCDFGICQIAFDGSEVLTTDAYRSDQTFEQFTLLRADAPMDIVRSVRRYDRLLAKYEGWEFTINTRSERFLPGF